jgi:carboxylesterase type B
LKNDQVRETFEKNRRLRGMSARLLTFVAYLSASTHKKWIRTAMKGKAMKHSFTKRSAMLVKDAMHAMEIPYAWNIPAAIVGDRVTAADKAMGAVAGAYWVEFAKTGAPNGSGRPLWPLHDPASGRVLNFTNKGVVVEPDPLQERLDLWQKVWTQGR